MTNIPPNLAAEADAHDVIAQLRLLVLDVLHEIAPSAPQDVGAHHQGDCNRA